MAIELIILDDIKLISNLNERGIENENRL